MRKFNVLKKTSLLIILTILITGFFVKNYADADEIKASIIQIAKIDYDLAYPGMLPDNPFYKLKVLRDKLSTTLISDPYKRTAFYLLQADKGILATAILIDKHRVDLANETALKAENNVSLLTGELYRFSEKPSNEFFNKLKTASLKHQEVLESLIERLPENEQKTLKTVLYFSKTNLNTIEKFENKKYYNKQ